MQEDLLKNIVILFFFYCFTKEMRTVLFMFVIDVVHALFSRSSENYVTRIYAFFVLRLWTEIKASNQNQNNINSLDKMEIEKKREAKPLSRIMAI